MTEIKLPKSLRIAVVGATGLVGNAMLQILAEQNVALEQIDAFASARSAGTTLPFGEKTITIRAESEMKESYDLIFGFCSSSVTMTLHDRWLQLGKVIIDNSSAYRLAPDVPLIVPEVNPHAISQHTGWIANPNCSTIQMVRAIRPLLPLGLREISVATYQSVSGIGRGGLTEWQAQRSGSQTVSVFRERIDENVVPWIGKSDEDGFTLEENKMRSETRKIFGLPALPVHVTCARVPVAIGHSEALHLLLDKPVMRADIIDILRTEPGLVVRDELAGERLPTALESVGSDDVFIGRIRTDAEDRRRVSLWVVADNVRVGAATNAFRIALRLFC